MQIIQKLRELYPEEDWQYCPTQQSWFCPTFSVSERQGRYIPEASAHLIEYVNSNGEVIEELGTYLERTTRKSKRRRLPYGSRQAEVQDGLAESVREVQLRRKKVQTRINRESALPHNRICACCGLLKLPSRAWVVFTEVSARKGGRETVAVATQQLGVSPATVTAVCKACWWRATH